MDVDLQKTAKDDDVNWIDLCYSPYVNVARKNVDCYACRLELRYAHWPMCRRLITR